MMFLDLVIDEYYSCKQTERLGQWFYNRYIKDGKPWCELFYEEDDRIAGMIIQGYIRGLNTDEH